MNRGDILDSLQTIIAERFEHAEPVTEDTVAAEVEGWDSVAYVELILDVERHFGIRLTTGEAANLPSVGALVSAVEKRLGKQ